MNNKDLKNEKLVQALLNFDNDIREIAVDLLLVVANKPTNYTGMRNYSLQQLYRLATESAIMCHPHRSNSDIISCWNKVESIFRECRIDMLSFEGLDPSSDHMTGARAYYERETHAQNIIFAVFFDQIDTSMKSLTASAREREKDVLKAWIAVLGSRALGEPRLVFPKMDEVAHHYQKEFERDMPTYINLPTITEILVRARLAYTAEGGLVPMWFTDRRWLEAQKVLVGV